MAVPLSRILRRMQRQAAPVAARPAPSTGLKELADAANEAAKREATQWFFFVTLMLYLMVAVGGVTHRKLFLEEPIPLPVINTPISLTGFFVVAPAILVVMHFYLVAQIGVMTGKVTAFLTAAEAEAGGDPTVLERILRRLDPFPVAQVMASALLGRREWPLRIMAWLTLIAAPVLLLLFFQVRFLPYQDEWITWWHRGLVLADLGLAWWVWLLWPRRPGERGGVPRIRAFMWSAASVCVVLFSLVASVRGGIEDRSIWSDHLNGPWFFEVRTWLFDGERDPVTNRPSSLFSRAIVLPNERLISDKDFEALAKAQTAEGTPGSGATSTGPEPVARTVSLRGRSLRGAVLVASDLRKADLTGADLRGARLHLVWLQGASLDGAQLQGASLNWAQLQGAALRWAQLQGASLDGAQLQGASLAGAQLQGASLAGAQLQGASLDGAQLQGASLNWAQLQGALLFQAGLQGASLAGTQLQGASLAEAQLQGASLERAQLQSANLHAANVWRASGEAILNDADLRGVVFIEARRRDDAGPTTWRTRIDAWLEAIPQGWARNFAERRLLVLVPSSTRDPDGYADLRRSWEAHPVPDPHRLADRLGDLACDAANAPHVARGILRQVAGLARPDRDLDPHRPNLARRMLNETACPGARGLTADERAHLRALAEGRR
ncbi:pentapeptide repeat-containing protein [Elioraea sp.]|uniref:pentapeptide repeat-containing protein n=1 Tax=Elioraea sp. TaxID=2185103 RepID=UPI003F6FBD8C